MKAMDHHNGITVTVTLEVIIHIASQYKKIIFEDTFFSLLLSLYLALCYRSCVKLTKNSHVPPNKN